MVVDTADTDLVVVSNSDSVSSADFRVVDSSSATREEGIRSNYLTDRLVVQRKRRTSLPEKKGDTSARVCSCC